MALNMDIYTKDLELTDRIKEYATRKSESWIGSSAKSVSAAWIWICKDRPECFRSFHCPGNYSRKRLYSSFRREGRQYLCGYRRHS